MDFAHHRQLFLTEQGYTYEILDETDLTASGVAGRNGTA
jgi:DNA excision repair protein ERCC-3